VGQRMTAVKTSIFTLLVPGTVAVFVPYLLVRADMGVFRWSLSAAHFVGGLLMLCGASLGLWCAGLFAVVGKGTPAPIDPPKDLVAVGAYRVVRNPMYVGIASVLFGEALFFHSATLAVYALAVTTGFHLFVVLYEEPALRKQFGKSYEDYCLIVSRWLPKIPPRY